MIGQASTEEARPAPTRAVDLRAVIAGGLVLLLVGAAALLSSSAPRRAGINGIRGSALLGQTSAGAGGTICQRGELLPATTGAIRISLAGGAGPGPALGLTVTRAGRQLTRGEIAAGWSGRTVAIPVHELGRSVAGVRICVGVAHGGTVELRGSEGSGAGVLPASLDGGPVPGRLRVEYLRPGRESWWSYAGTVAHRMGLARAWTGSWVAWAVAALMLAAAALSLGRLVRDQAPAPVRRVPTAAWVCALVACCNALAWALITPPFQVPDEQDHFAYVQRLAETGRPPAERKQVYSAEEQLALGRLKFGDITTRRGVGIWSGVEQRQLDRELGSGLSRVGPNAAGHAARHPPLYYALEAVPYRIARGGSLLDRLALMRLVSALLAGITALFAFLFLRELLPSTPWAWTVGGLAFALQPLFGFISGGVNPDSLLFAGSTALFYCLARAFRRGLTPGLSVATGAAIAVGSLGKLALFGLLPGALIALVAIALRQEPRGSRLRALRLPALACVVAFAPIALLALLNSAVWDRPALRTAAITPVASNEPGSLLGQINFVWQFFLPRLPGTPHDFPGRSTIREFWFNGFVGVFGWSSNAHPAWVYRFALIPGSVALVLAGRTLLDAGTEVRRRAVELATYGLMAAGLVVSVGAYFYPIFLSNHAAALGQSRYLLPLGALFAAVVALAARGGGRRWGPALGAAIVLVALAHDLGSQLLVISQWYA